MSFFRRKQTPIKPLSYVSSSNPVFDTLLSPRQPGIGATYVPKSGEQPYNVNPIRQNQPPGELIAKIRHGDTEKYGYINPATSGKVKPETYKVVEGSEGMGGAKKSKSKKTTKQSKKPAAKQAKPVAKQAKPVAKQAKAKK